MQERVPIATECVLKVFSVDSKKVCYHCESNLALFGDELCNTFKLGHGDIIMKLAKIGAIRIVYYAMINNIGLEECDKMVYGLFAGNQGSEGEFLKNEIGKIVDLGEITVEIIGGGKMSDKVKHANRKKVRYSVEGLFTRCAFAAPNGSGYNFYIDKDLHRRSSLSEDSVSVSYLNLSKNSERNNLIPKYGYACLSAATLGSQLPPHAGQHFPKKPTRKDRKDEKGEKGRGQNSTTFEQLRFRFVSYSHVEKYLMFCKSDPLQLSFPMWLCKSDATNFPVDSCYPIFRGTISESQLSRKGLSFALGNFEVSKWVING